MLHKSAHGALIIKRFLNINSKANLNVQKLFQFNPKNGAALVSKINPLKQRTGLFGRAELEFPDGFGHITEKAFKLCNELVRRVITSHNMGDLDGCKMLVKRLDRLSEILCSVVDTAELVRNVHPDKQWCAAADLAHQKISRFLNELNTNVELYQALQNALSNSDISSAWSNTERRVAEMLLRDFQKSAIHLPERQRNQFVQLNDEIMHAGSEFCGPSHHPSGSRHVTLTGPPETTLQGLDSTLISKLSNFNRTKVHIPLPPDDAGTGLSGAARYIISNCRNRETRRLVYLSLNALDDHKLNCLSQMLTKRQELAGVAGKASYSELALADAMLNKPDAVVSFLQTLANQEKPKAESVMKSMSALASFRLQEFDVPFYERFLPDRNRFTSELAEYISVGSAISGLLQLFSAMYGVTFEVTDMSPGESWHPDVCKVVVAEANGKALGVFYLDLFERSDPLAPKYSMPAHFTVQCSRLLKDDEPLFGDSRENIYKEESQQVRQLPKVVLVCAFPKGTNGLGLLSWTSLETLCHEMGHAMHSMLGQTDFQHISGTRTQIDFVEIPSIFMEELLQRNPSLWQLFTTHAQTGEQMPDRLVSLLEPIVRNKDYIESQFHTVMALADQYYHHPPLNPFGACYTPEITTQIFHMLQNQYHVVPALPGTAWQTNFNHIFPYGTGYYTYSWCRKWSKKMVDAWFSGLAALPASADMEKVTPLLQKGGSTFYSNVLKPGAGLSGWEIFEKSKLLRK